MKHVIKVTALPDYRLVITFDDHRQFEFDMAPYLYGEMFEPLKDPQFFNLVTVDPDFGCICWPNGADLAPDYLYMLMEASTMETHQT